MKKIILSLLMLTISTSALAYVQVFNNLPSDKKIFIQSFKDGKKFYATNIGTSSVVPTQVLRKYDNSPFTIGIEGGVTLMYCTMHTDKSVQFAFIYKNMGNKMINLEMQPESKGSEILMPVCKGMN